VIYNEEKDFSAIQMDSFYERLLNFLNVREEKCDEGNGRQICGQNDATYKESWRGNEGPADEVGPKRTRKCSNPDARRKFEYDLPESDAAMMFRVA